MAIIMGLGLLFYIILGFWVRGLRNVEAKIPENQMETQMGIEMKITFTLGSRGLLQYSTVQAFALQSLASIYVAKCCLFCWGEQGRLFFIKQFHFYSSCLGFKVLSLS